MIFTKSVGAVVFYKSPSGQIEFLLLNHGKEHNNSVEYWNFPKGTAENGETEKATALREIKEETGLADLKLFSRFRETERYFCRGTKPENRGKLIFKTAVFFLAQVENRGVKISSEHIGWEWLDFATASRRLNFNQSRSILKKADKFLYDYFSRTSF